MHVSNQQLSFNNKNSLCLHMSVFNKYWHLCNKQKTSVTVINSVALNYHGIYAHNFIILKTLF